jgi:phosphoribosylamine---glycine ligase
MRVLVVGGGGREHALVWKLVQSPHAERVYCAPGNAGISRIAECINLRPTDLEGLANFAANQRIDLTIVGPEAPLIAGIVDRFEARGLPVFGPATDPARIEGSKAFAKELMVRYGIPTADYKVCDTAGDAHVFIHDYYASHASPGTRLVVKADGLAAGKGVVVAQNETEAHEAADRIMRQRVFGAAGDRAVIEEYLEGEEVSIMAFTDGESVIPMPPAQDHKRVWDNDCGPNTGGMGAYSPVPTLPASVPQEALDTVLIPAVAAIKDLGIPYKGVLYAGLIITPQGMKALEFNCRFGDPETQVVVPLLESDLLEIMDTTVNCCLDHADVRWRSQAAVSVVAASGGYPGEYATGKLIEGLERAAQTDGCMVFHAGTRDENGLFLTDGGRVLAVTGLGADIAEAQRRAYAGMSCVRFDGIHYRKDIANRALK